MVHFSGENKFEEMQVHNLRSIISDACLNDAVEQQQRPFNDLMTDLFTLKLRSNASKDFDVWASNKFESLKRELKSEKHILEEELQIFACKGLRSVNEAS